MSQPTVLFDPGHGGRDPGAVGDRNTYEAFVNLRMSFLIAGYLHWVSLGLVETCFTRSQNEYVLVKERVDIEHDIEVDLFVSVHANAATSKRARGCEVLYYSSRSSGFDVAKQIIEEVENEFPIHGDGLVKRPGLGVLRYTKAPAVLVETLFLSNSQDLKILTDEVESGKLAHRIAVGIWESNPHWI